MMQSELLLPISNFSFSTYQNPNDFDHACFSLFEHFDHDDMIIDDGFEILRKDRGGIFDWVYANHSNEVNSFSSAEVFASANEWSPCPSLESSQNTQILTDMPIYNLREIDNELSLHHLSRAYGEAIDGGNQSLAKVIVDSIKEKSNPQGNTMERIAYHMFKSKDEHGEYLRQESSKNFVNAFNVLYQSLICGRFAHNAANAAIIESIPNDAKVIHIFDFDIREGIQWPALLEALSQKPIHVRITSMKLTEDCNSSCWEFEETARRLQDHARQYGLRLQVEEKSLKDFSAEMMNNAHGREWLVFNMMVGLPHMAQRRRRSNVVKFLRVAEEVLSSYNGLLTIGDGEAGDGLRDCTSFDSYFGKLLKHYQALFESLEENFPSYLMEARTALECMFLAPSMCPTEWFEEWKEMVNDGKLESLLQGRKVSWESFGEAKVMVNEGENWYNVKIEGLKENEMVLRWKESVVVRVSTFCGRREQTQLL